MFSTKSPKDLILERISEYDIFNHYIPCGFEVNGNNISSPLRTGDSNPSFRVFTTNSGLRYRDYGSNKAGDCFQFVSDLLNIPFHSALRQIDIDFNLKLFVYNESTKTSEKEPLITNNATLKPREKTKIKFLPRPLNDEDLKYWGEFNISLKTLRHFKVRGVSKFHIFTPYSSFIKNADPLSFVYNIGSRVKFYQPKTNNSKYKFFGTTNRNSIQGYDFLDPSKKTVLITASFKEIFVLYELGIQAIAPNSESTIIDKWIIEHLKQTYNLILFYDWDEAGITNVKNHSKYYNLPYIIPDLNQIGNTKDFSDYSKAFGILKSEKLINNLLQNG